MENEKDTLPGSPPAVPSAPASLEETEQAISFVNQQVLDPQVTPIQGTAKPLADQAAAMMIEDMRSFLQGTEQVMTVALAKAAAMAMNPATSEIGNKALKSLGEFMKDLPTFASSIGSSASTIAKEFDGSGTAAAPVIPEKMENIAPEPERKGWWHSKKRNNQ